MQKGKESRHNLNYWRRGEYIGFGVSASSHINNVRFTNTFDLDEYFKCIMTNRFPVVDSQEVDKAGQAEEAVMLALRTAEGLNVAAFNKQFDCDFDEFYADALKKNGAYLERKGDSLRVKDEYLYVQNSIICDFLS